MVHAPDKVENHWLTAGVSKL